MRTTTYMPRDILFKGVLYAAVTACILWIAFGCAALKPVTDPLTENSARAGLSIGVGLALFFLIPGGELLRAGLGMLGTYVTQAASTAADEPALPVPGVPWYFDPMAYVWLVVKWLAVAIVLGLVFRRSREHTVQFVKDMASLRPTAGAKRFAAGMGWIHSSKTDPKKAKDKR